MVGMLCRGMGHAGDLGGQAPSKYILEILSGASHINQFRSLAQRRHAIAEYLWCTLRRSFSATQQKLASTSCNSK